MGATFTDGRSSRWCKVSGEVLAALASFKSRAVSATGFQIIMVLLNATQYEEDDGFGSRTSKLTRSGIGEALPQDRNAVRDALDQLTAAGIVYEEEGRFGIVLDFARWTVISPEHHTVNRSYSVARSVHSVRSLPIFDTPPRGESAAPAEAEARSFLPPDAEKTPAKCGENTAKMGVYEREREKHPPSPLTREGQEPEGNASLPGGSGSARSARAAAVPPAAEAAAPRGGYAATLNEDGGEIARENAGSETMRGTPETAPAEKTPRVEPRRQREKRTRTAEEPEDPHAWCIRAAIGELGSDGRPAPRDYDFPTVIQPVTATANTVRSRWCEALNPRRMAAAVEAMKTLGLSAIDSPVGYMIRAYQSADPDAECPLFKRWISRKAAGTLYLPPVDRARRLLYDTEYRDSAVKIELEREAQATRDRAAAKPAAAETSERQRTRDLSNLEKVRQLATVLSPYGSADLLEFLALTCVCSGAWFRDVKTWLQTGRPVRLFGHCDTAHTLLIDFRLETLNKHRAARQAKRTQQTRDAEKLAAEDREKLAAAAAEELNQLRAAVRSTVPQLRALAANEVRMWKSRRPLEKCPRQWMLLSQLAISRGVEEITAAVLGTLDLDGPGSTWRFSAHQCRQVLSAAEKLGARPRESEAVPVSMAGVMVNTPEGVTIA
jgi:hypothetical protein